MGLDLISKDCISKPKHGDLGRQRSADQAKRGQRVGKAVAAGMGPGFAEFKSKHLRNVPVPPKLDKKDNI